MHEPIVGALLASTEPAIRWKVRSRVLGEPAEWCTRHDRRRTGTKWEIYGPHRDDPAELTTEVSWLLSSP